MNFGIILNVFWDYLRIILESLWEILRIILGSFQIDFEVIGGSFWSNFGVVWGSFWALGVLLGRSGGPRRIPRVSKSVKMWILKLLNNFKEDLKSSWSDLRASKIGPGGVGNGPGATKEAKMVDLGVILGSFWGSFWGHFGVEKRH